MSLPSDEAGHAARNALLEAALLAVLRAAEEDGFEGFTVAVGRDDGQTFIDLSYIRAGKAMAGQSL